MMKEGESNIMQDINLIGERTVSLENNKHVTISYFLVKEDKVRPLYGIKIIQKYDSSRFLSEYTEPLSYSKDYVVNILHKLMDHNVLISNLIETVDDLIV